MELQKTFHINLKTIEIMGTIRKKGDTYFIATHQGIVDMKQFGKFANIYFLECDIDGNIKDNNGNGVIQKRDIYCKLPKDKDTLDLSTLSEDCLN